MLKHCCSQKPYVAVSMAASQGTRCIYVAGKSAMCMEQLIQSRGSGLKLPEGGTLMHASQMPQLSEENFSVEHYMSNLNTKVFGGVLLYSPCLPSTQTILSENFRAFPEGTVCLADIQKSGKGRAGNVWSSPPGCLTFSFTLQMKDGRAVPFVQYIISLAVIEAIDSVCSDKGLPMIDVKIKWPNDLYAKGLKIGGVLCTSTYSDKKFNIVIGVGLNVKNLEPTTCLNALLRDINPQTTILTREELLVAILSKFEELFQNFNENGFTALEESYYKNWLHSGQRVVIEEKETSGVSSVYLTIKGLTPSGYLLAVDDDHKLYELHPDGNSFDFFKGLIKTKIAD